MSMLFGIGFTKAVSVGALGGVALVGLALIVVGIIGFGADVARWGDE